MALWRRGMVLAKPSRVGASIAVELHTSKTSFFSAFRFHQWKRIAGTIVVAVDRSKQEAMRQWISSNMPKALLLSSTATGATLQNALLRRERP